MCVPLHTRPQHRAVGEVQHSELRTPRLKKEVLYLVLGFGLGSSIRVGVGVGVRVGVRVRVRAGVRVTVGVRVRV